MLYNFTFANLYHFIVTIIIISTDVSKFNSLHLIKMVDVFQNLISKFQNVFQIFRIISDSFGMEPSPNLTLQIYSSLLHPGL